MSASHPKTSSGFYVVCDAKLNIIIRYSKSAEEKFSRPGELTGGG